MSANGELTLLSAHARGQARACESLGSPFYATLLQGLAQDIEHDGPTARLMRGHGDSGQDLLDQALVIRLLGGVHRLVLTGAAPALAAHYPSTGGDGDAHAALQPFLAVLDSHEPAVRAALLRPPQTNEVGRSATLVGALCHVVDASPLPIRLLEIGASAGLNLRCDRFRIGADDGSWYGPEDSPARLPSAWRGRLPPRSTTLDVIERTGCDLHPLDPASPDDALTLTSYVWPDQIDRLTRLRGGLELAREVPVAVERAGAAEFLGRARLQPGSWLVVMHSVMWQYLDPDERVAARSRIDELGAAATPDAPLAHVAFEPTGDDFLVSVQTWPDVGLGSGERILGRARPHGIPVDWR